MRNQNITRPPENPDTPFSTLPVDSVPLVGGSTELLPPARRKRVVIVGGGWGGLSAARAYNHTFIRGEVVAIERDTHRVATDQEVLAYD
jgi:NADH dehydrogenase FAD-containing subunit